MNGDMIFPGEALRKLKLAHGLHTGVYLYGATGYGKTTLLRRFPDSKSAIWFSCREPAWDTAGLEQALKSARQPVCVVFDDVQLIFDESQQELICGLLQRQGAWVVLLSRTPAPGWLLPMLTGMRIVVISEDDMRLNGDEIRRIASGHNLTLSDAEVDYLRQQSQGNAMAVTLTLQQIAAGERLGLPLAERLTEVFGDYLEQHIIRAWPNPLQDFLTQVSVVDEFTQPLAEAITGDDQTPLLLNQANEAGNFLFHEGGTYRIRPVMLEALRRRASKVYGMRGYNQRLYNAAHYYELHDEILRALPLYEQCGEMASIRELLIRNARRHPGVGYYYELRRYYLALTPEEVGDSPALMSALSLLHSVLMNPDESERWYTRLKEYARTSTGGQRQEAASLILYLDIALPHRGSVNLVDIIKAAPGLLLRENTKLPEFSITNNQPSVMNGSKDFCEWSKTDELLAATMGKPVTFLLGRLGIGLVDEALGESKYERAEDNYLVMSHLSRAQSESESRGSLEIAFAAAGLLARLNTVVGNVESALRLLDGIEDQARKAGLTRLMAGVASLRCRICLIDNRMDQTNAWMRNCAPNESEGFCTLERYHYLTKVRCYMANGQDYEALSLLARMKPLIEISHRTYLRMETGVLTAVVQHRLRIPWEEGFLTALNAAAGYRFIRLISEEGAAVLPLLRRIRRAYLDQPHADKAWFDHLLTETEAMARRYPGYQASRGVSLSEFSPTALAVLRLQASGLSSKEIAAELSISLRTVKYHAAENYRKLGVNSKTEAVQLARTMNIL